MNIYRYKYKFVTTVIDELLFKEALTKCIFTATYILLPTAYPYKCNKDWPIKGKQHEAITGFQLLLPRKRNYPPLFNHIA